MRSVFFLLALASIPLLIAGCSTPGNVIQVDPVEFKELIQGETVFVLDVHIPQQQHIQGTDALIPYNELNENKDKLPSTDVPIALYCRSGSMSSQAGKELAEMGYTVYELKGGRNAYIAEFGED